MHFFFFFLASAYEGEDAILFYVVLTYFTQSNLKFHLLHPSLGLNQALLCRYTTYPLSSVDGCLVCINNLAIVNDPTKSTDVQVSL